jgi:peptide/nickel transport system permease protein
MKRVLSVLARRLVAGVSVLLAMITLVFVLYWALPTEPAQFVYPTAPHLTNYQLRTAHHFLGLDRPKLEQYGAYLWHLARGDFGREWENITITADQKPSEPAIGPIIFPRIRETLSIVLGGALLVVLLAVPLGAIAGRRIGSIGDRTISLLALIGICTHPMVVGLILRTVFSNRLHWTPPTGYCTLGHDSHALCSGPVNWAEHLILPWITFALLFLALYIRMVRASVAETMHEDFVRTARAKGASEFRVITRHVLPNAGLRVLTMVGMEIGTAIGVAVYIEAAFAIPGLGNLAVTTMFGTVALDLPLMLAVITVITAIVVIGNLVVDTLYAVVDPRAGATMRDRRTKSLAGGVI